MSDTQHEIVDVGERIHEAVRLVRLSPDTRGLTFDIDIASRSHVKGDANLLMQVFVNLINNACDASPDGANVRLSSQRTNDELIIETIDEGKGVDPAAREQMFEPFFTTKPVGQGTGLGLSLAYSIIKKHHGKLRIGNSEKGTRMIVSLPLHIDETS